MVSFERATVSHVALKPTLNGLMGAKTTLKSQCVLEETKDLGLQRKARGNKYCG
jgi:hypothetical protein